MKLNIQIKKSESEILSPTISSIEYINILLQSLHTGETHGHQRGFVVDYLLCACLKEAEVQLDHSLYDLPVILAEQYVVEQQHAAVVALAALICPESTFGRAK